MTRLDRAKAIRFLETSLLIIGLALLALYGAVRIYSSYSSQAAIGEFSAAIKKAQETRSAALPPEGPVDFSLWSEKRLAAYRQSLELKRDGPIAVLRIPSIRLEVPVFDGTDELTLNRGAGRILGTARVGQAGNIGIAGHRDGFFRCLKDVRIGDPMELAALDRSTKYVVQSVEIVSPDDVSVLRPRDLPAVTLVTCYPFYFVGDAPQRYIIHGTIVDGERPDAGLETPRDAEAGPNKGRAFPN